MEAMSGEAEESLFSRICRFSSGSGKTPLVGDVLESPGDHGFVSPFRSELMIMVYRSLQKQGYFGTPQDVRISEKIFEFILLRNGNEEVAL